MSSTCFEPQSTSTPKRDSFPMTSRPLCSTPRPTPLRWSLSKQTPQPIHCSTPNIKKTRKSLAPELIHLIYPTHMATQPSMKVWVL